jgi:hypothetical protein
VLLQAQAAVASGCGLLTLLVHLQPQEVVASSTLLQVEDCRHAVAANLEREAQQQMSHQLQRLADSEKLLKG